MFGFSKLRKRLPSAASQFVQGGRTTSIEEYGTISIRGAGESESLLLPAGLKANEGKGDKTVNLVRPTEPPVTLLEKFLFYVWSVMLVLTQVWRDFTEKRPFRAVLKSDFTAHYFVSMFT